MNMLVQQLVSVVGVSETQAEGGSGLLLKLLREKLSTSDFAEVSAVIPNAEGLLEAVPGTAGGGLLGALGGLVSGFGGGKFGDLAGLAAGFSKLGLDSSMLGPFLTVLLGYIQRQGGNELAERVKKALDQ